jgi:hypothetical protein
MDAGKDVVVFGFQDDMTVVGPAQRESRT